MKEKMPTKIQRVERLLKMDVTLVQACKTVGILKWRRPLRRAKTIRWRPSSHRAKSAKLFGLGL